jgi:SSS family solute:Na+ symporter
LEKVHAAEFLLDLGYTNTIYDTFLEEEKHKGNKYYYRIGIWRVLAKASLKPRVKQQWLDSISKVFKDPATPDQIHATESLAKLGVSPYNVASNVTDSILNGTHNIMWVYTLWGTAYTADMNMNVVKNKLAGIIGQKEESTKVRRLAAYALRNLKDIGTFNWGLLINAACHEPDTSSAYPYILSSVLVNTPKDSLLSTRVQYCRRELEKIAATSCNKGRYEALSTLGELGVKSDLPLLSSLITDLEIKLSGKVDIGLAASNAILRIDRRQKYTLTGIDWSVIVLFAIGMLLVGWYYSKKTKNTEDYLLGGRKMKPMAVGLSLFATMISSLSYLSYPGEMIKNGPVFFIGMLILPLIYYVVGWFLIPRFMEMKVTSAYELLEQKLGLSVRLLATFFFLTLRFLWMAAILYITINTALVTIVDISPFYTPFISSFLMLLTILYTSMGGFKAVVTTDVIQSVVLWGGAFFTLVVVVLHFHSFTSWLPDHYLEYWSPLKWGIDVHERTTVGNAMIMLFVWFICTNGSDQMAVQRYLSTKNVQAARRTFGISLIATFIVKIFLAIVGLAMLAYFLDNPHFLNDGQTLTKQADNLFPKFILVGLPVGISGIVAAGILAAAMSSLSSGLNSSSSVISEDIIKRLFPGLISVNPLKQVKIISVLVGVVTILISLTIGNVRGNLLDIIFKTSNLFVAPLFVLFFMAIFIPFSTSKGTIIGGLISVAMAVSAAFWEFTGIKALWIMPAALVAGIIAGVVASSVEKAIIKIRHHYEN